MNASSTVAAEVALASLFNELAATLLALDVTPSRLAQIARASFVRAGFLSARIRSSGRPHIARIAAITGLSRVEVKKIVDARFVIGRAEPEQLPRAMRVLTAWKSAKGYSTNGRPRPLRVTGTAPSFEALCKQSSGDIPHKVILSELELRHIVRLTNRRSMVTVSRTRKSNAAVLRDVEALNFAASFIAALVQSEDVLVRKKVRVQASTQIPIAYVQRAVADRVVALADSLPALFSKKSSNTRNREAALVFTLVSRPRSKSK